MPLVKFVFCHVSLRPIILVGVVGIFSMPLVVNAQQWQFDPVFSGSARYNDNVRLRRDDEVIIESASIILDANARFIRRTDTSEVRFAPRVFFRDYESNNLDDIANVFLNMFARKQAQRSRYGAEARLSRQDVLAAELEDPDFDDPDILDPVSVDSGQVRIQTKRDRTVLYSFFENELTERLGLGLDARYIDVSYDNTENGLVDYHSATVGGQVDFQLSERSSWSLRSYATDFESSRLDDVNDSKAVGIRIEFRRRFSEKFDGHIRIGYEDIDSDLGFGGTTVSENSSATVYGIGVRHTGDISRLVFDVSQSVDPNGTGFLQERSQFRLRYTRQLSPRTSVNLLARYLNAQNINVATSAIERDYQQHRVGIEWRLSQKWSLEPNYTFTYQSFSDQEASASYNAVGIRLTYQPLRGQ